MSLDSELIEIQLRSEKTGMTWVRNEFTWQNALTKAYEHVEMDPTIWKVSFSIHNTRHRLVKRNDGKWENRPIVCLDEAPWMSEDAQQMLGDVYGLVTTAGFNIA